MAKDIWVTSDTHFHHSNMLNFIDYKGNKVRDFDTVEIMDEYMMNKWNSVVKPGDIVYHLGDVFIGPKDKFKSFWPKLNGSKRALIGNHDDIQFLSSGGFFKKTLFWRMFTEHGLIFHHVPLHPTSLFRGKDLEAPMFQVHGHIHRNTSPIGPYRNVCVEVTGYTPVHIDQLAAEAKAYRENQWSTDKKLFESIGII